MMNWLIPPAQPNRGIQVSSRLVTNRDAIGSVRIGACVEDALMVGDDHVPA